MTKISPKKLSFEKTGLLIDQLWRAVTLLENKNEVHDFLHDILTRTEIQMLAKRLEIVKQLEAGRSYFQIRKDLNVTDSTIARIHNWYDAFGQGYKLIIARLNEYEEKRQNIRSGPRRQVTAAEVALRVGINVAKNVYKKHKKKKSAFV